MRYHDWHAGMKVVCIRADDTNESGLQELELNRIYTIRDIADWDFVSSPEGASISVWLEEVVREVSPDCLEDGEVPFCASRFRPLARRATDISVFTRMLKEREADLVA